MTPTNLDNLLTGKVCYLIMITIGLGLTDYPIIVKNPNDLGTVKKKLLNMRYKNVE